MPTPPAETRTEGPARASASVSRRGTLVSTRDARISALRAAVQRRPMVAPLRWTAASMPASETRRSCRGGGIPASSRSRSPARPRRGARPRDRPLRARGRAPFPAVRTRPDDDPHAPDCRSRRPARFAVVPAGPLAHRVFATARGPRSLLPEPGALRSLVRRARRGRRHSAPSPRSSCRRRRLRGPRSSPPRPSSRRAGPCGRDPRGRVPQRAVRRDQHGRRIDLPRRALRRLVESQLIVDESGRSRGG